MYIYIYTYVNIYICLKTIPTFPLIESDVESCSINTDGT